MNLAHGQRNSILWFLPGEEANLGLGREHRALHRDRVGVAGTSSGRIRTGFWQLRTKSRVTVNTKSGLVSNILVVNCSAVCTVISGRLALI